MAPRENPLGLPEATPGGILALDLATVTGWAYGSSQDRKPVYGSVSFAKAAARSRQHLLDACYHFVCHACEFYSPRLLVSEQALVTNFRDRDGTIKHVVSNDETISILRQLIGTAWLAAHHWDVPVLEYTPTTFRSGVMKGMPVLFNAKGKRDDKAMAIRWCQANGYWPEDDNAADALTLLEYVNRTHEGFGHAL